MRWHRQAVLGLQVTLAGKKSTATRGSSRADGDIYIDNKWVTVKELLILRLLGTMSSCMQGIYFPAVYHHVIET